jgi:predicted dehydrogenase
MPNGLRSTRNNKVRFAVVGLGHVSQTMILPAFAHAGENSQLTGLVSGNPAKLRRLSRKYNVEHTYSYEKYSDCLRSGEIDAVYVALPNYLHSAYTVAAARAGIHVLCEKPMAFEESECESMIAAVNEGGVKLMLAYPMHFGRGNLQAVEAIKSGKIGEPRIFTSVFSRQIKSAGSRLKKDGGGGVLYEMGINCIHAARLLFGAEPLEVFASGMSVTEKRFREAPEICAGMLKFPNDHVASFTVSFGAADSCAFEVIGTKGVLKMESAYEMAKDLKSEIAIGNWKIKEIFSRHDQFVSELVYFSNCVLNDRKPEPSGEVGLADVRIIRALLLSARTNMPVSIAPVSAGQAPDVSHDFVTAPVIRRPQLVRTVSSAAD